MVSPQSTKSTGFLSLRGEHLVNEKNVQITRILSIPFEENAYVARLPDRDDCLVVDPGLEPQKILDYLHQQQLEPAAILNTHGHSDHIAGNGALKECWPDCPLVIGVGDAPKLTDPQQNLSALFGASLVSPPADVLLRDGQNYSAAGFDLEVIAVPGHSAGHVVYLWKDHSPCVAFVGDVVFAGGIGRTDFPDGDTQALLGGIRQKLFTLPADTLLLPGHGEPTTVDQERRTNPWVGGS
jgi:glyoxylase-like metal-dependent hydrolase (beta-lactamase superfamily II)